MSIGLINTVWIILLISVTSISTFGQDEIQNLRSKIVQVKDDGELPNLYNKLGFAFRRKYSVDSAITYHLMAKELADHNGDKYQHVLALTELSHCYTFSGDKEKWKDVAYKGYALAKDLNDPNSLVQTHFGLSNYFLQTVQYDSALFHALEAKQIAGENERVENKILSALQLGYVHKGRKDFDQAEPQFLEAYNLSNQINSKKNVSTVLIELVDLYWDHNKQNQYSIWSERMFDYFKDIPYMRGHDYLFEAHLMFDLDNSDEVIKKLKENISLHQANGSQSVKTSSQLALANIYRKRDLNNLAIPLYKEIIDFGIGTEIDFSLKALREIIPAYKSIRDFENALNYTELFNHLNDSLNNIEVEKNFDEINVKFETVEKEALLARQEIDLQQASRSRFILISIVVTLLFLGAIISFYLYQRTKLNRILAQKNDIIQKALKEKDILLKEIHHRVKNNLQVVSSLLGMQSMHLKDDDSLNIFRESQNRVQSMSIIHQELYQGEHLIGIEIDEYISQLADHLFESYQLDEGQIEFIKEISPIHLDIDSAIPLGLIVNELISNALKYAFPDKSQKGKLTLKLFELDHHLILEVTDNGAGFDTAALEKESFGWELIHTLSKQLDAQIQLKQEHGTAVKLTINKYRKSA